MYFKKPAKTQSTEEYQNKTPACFMGNKCRNASWLLAVKAGHNRLIFFTFTIRLHPATGQKSHVYFMFGTGNELSDD